MRMLRKRRSRSKQEAHPCQWSEVDCRGCSFYRRGDQVIMTGVRRHLGTEPKREGEFLKEMRLRDWPSSPGMVSYQKRHMGKYSDKITDSNRG